MNDNKDLPQHQRVASSNGDSKEYDPTAYSRAIVDRFARLESFLDQEGLIHFRVPSGEHHALIPLNSPAFVSKVHHVVYAAKKKEPSQGDIATIRAELSRLVEESGRTSRTFNRIGYQNNGYPALDLGSVKPEVIALNENGFQTGGSEVDFVRPAGLRALPLPIRTGRTLAEILGELLDALSHNALFWLSVWLVAIFNPDGIMPFFVISGGRDGRDSLLAWCIKNIVDPSTADLRHLPRDERDLLLPCKNSLVLAFHNINDVTKGTANLLRHLQKGGGTSFKQLYSDSTELFVGYRHPVILSGPGHFLQQKDLLATSISIELPFDPQTCRETEAAFRTRFHRLLPELLGAVLTSVSVAVRDSTQIRSPQYSHLPDFYQFVKPAERTMGFEIGTLEAAIADRAAGSVSLVLESSAVAQYLIHWIKENPMAGDFTATELLDLIRDSVIPGVQKQNLPKNAAGLSKELNQILAELSHVGVKVEFCRTDYKRTIRISPCPVATGVIAD